MHVLDKVITTWESEEHSLEEKMDSLEQSIFQHLGFVHKPDYYVKKGGFLSRYLAGFIHRSFELLKDFSFIVLDPLHIFDIFVAFAKGIITHPIKTLKQIWNCWTSDYSNGIYGLGAMTADAFLACLIAGATTAIIEGEGLAAVESAAEKFSEVAVEKVYAIPQQIKNIGEAGASLFNSHQDFFNLLKENPKQILADAKKSLESGFSYGEVRNYKLYSENFLKRSA